MSNKNKSRNRKTVAASLENHHWSSNNKFIEYLIIRQLPEGNDMCETCWIEVLPSLAGRCLYDNLLILLESTLLNSARQLQIKQKMMNLPDMLIKGANGLE